MLNLADPDHVPAPRILQVKPALRVDILAQTAARRPGSVLAELRYHLGLSGLLPQEPMLDCDGPALAWDHSGDQLPRRPRPTPGPAAAVAVGSVRSTFVAEDAVNDLIQTVPQWLA